MKKINNQNQKFTTLLATFLLISCNSNYTVSTNLDSDNFKDYFSPGQVTIFQSEKDMVKRYKFIGLVEGEDCQLKSHHAAPDEINARTHARKQAFEREANAIVFTGCATINDTNTNQQPQKQQCLSTLVCYGKAYQVVTKSEFTNTDNKQ
jgi:RcsF protein